MPLCEPAQPSWPPCSALHSCSPPLTSSAQPSLQCRRRHNLRQSAQPIYRGNAEHASSEDWWVITLLYPARLVGGGGGTIAVLTRFTVPPPSPQALPSRRQQQRWVGIQGPASLAGWCFVAALLFLLRLCRRRARVGASWLPFPSSHHPFPSLLPQRPCRRRLAAVQASSDPLLQKPVARPAAPAEGAAAAPAEAAPAAAAAAEPSGVTIEYQRQQAKAMRQYFKNLKAAETVERSKCVGIDGRGTGSLPCLCLAPRAAAAQATSAAK